MCASKTLCLVTLKHKDEHQSKYEWKKPEQKKMSIWHILFHLYINLENSN